VRGRYRNITLIGEVLDEYNSSEISQYQTMHDFDALFNFPLYTKIKETFIHGSSMTALARSRISDNETQGVLDIDTQLYTNANRLITLLDNHDLRHRIKTEILNCWGHWDRMRANRILKLCLSFLFTTRGIPQIYYGTEIGLEGDSDPHNRRDMRWDIFDDSFQPHPSDTEYRDAKEIFKHTKKLIKIRKENEAIPFGYLFTLYSDHFIYSYMREFRGNTIVVVINNGLERMPYPLRINIGRNSSIPSRIKYSLEGKTLQNQLDPDDEISYENGYMEVQLEGKDAKIYKPV
jgi:alpha-amylase